MSVEDITIYKDLGIGVVALISIYSIAKLTGERAFKEVDNANKCMIDTQNRLATLMETAYKDNTRSIAEFVSAFKDFSRIKDDILSSVSNNFNGVIKSASPDLTNRITNKSIDYISPIKPSSGMKIDENGQISAISSSKVTYTKNKYIVQRGDSLATIAQQVYGDREAWVRIAKANNLASPDNIEIGMELVIPR